MIHALIFPLHELSSSSITSSTNCSEKVMTLLELLTWESILLGSLNTLLSYCAIISSGPIMGMLPSEPISTASILFNTWSLRVSPSFRSISSVSLTPSSKEIGFDSAEDTSSPTWASAASSTSFSVTAGYSSSFSVGVCILITCGSGISGLSFSSSSFVEALSLLSDSEFVSNSEPSVFSVGASLSGTLSYVAISDRSSSFSDSVSSSSMV